MTMIEQFKSAQRAAVPLMAIRTPDHAATIGGIAKHFKESPLFVWDTIRSIRGGNELSQHWLKEFALTNNIQSWQKFGNPVEMLVFGHQLPEGSVLFLMNAHRYMENSSFAQALWNLRDAFKENHRMAVVLCPFITLPGELNQDVLVLDEPLPDVEQISKIILDCYEAGKVAKPKEDVRLKAVDALCGLTAFGAEQACYMSMQKNGLDLEGLWERKRQQIEQAPGLSVWRGKESFAGIGGCMNIKGFLARVLTGREAPRAIVFIDEIEKALAGNAGDLSGVSQEMFGELLSFMQNKEAVGSLFIGHAGTAKSAIAKAAGNEGGIPTISFNISEMKGSLIGSSGGNMRNALKVVEAVSQKRALFIGTCNAIESLPPEIRRRFSFGTFFFDLPTEEERESIWKIYVKKYSLAGDNSRGKINDEGWTGHEIETCCKLAWKLNCSLLEASKNIVPVVKSAPEKIENLRKMADGRYISASTEGVYEKGGDLQESHRSSRRAIGV